MRVSALLAFNAVCNLCFGLVMLAVPAWMMSLYGVRLDAGGMFMARMAGSAFLGFAVLTWLSSKLPEEALHAAVLPGLFVWFAAGILTELYAQVTGVTNLLGWSTILLAAFFLAGYGYFLWGPSARRQASASAG